MHVHAPFVFTQPLLLLTAFLALPALWFSRRSLGRVTFSSLAALPAHGKTWRTRLAWLPDALLVAAFVTMAVALAGPRAGDKNARIRRDGIAMVMAVDTSGSMKALDLSSGGAELTRLDAVKQVFEEFVLGGKNLAGRPDDAIGLIGFAGHADTRSPLTLDHGNLITAARQLDFPTEPGEDGTALGDGLALAIERVRQHPAKSKVVILLTDGVENAGTLNARSAIDIAVEQGVKVYTVGAGTTGVAPMRIDRGMGSELVQVPVEIDEETLREIASRTGGQYFRATDHTALESVYAQIDKLERTKLEEDRFTEYDELYGMFLMCGLALATLGLVLRSTLLRRLP